MSDVLTDILQASLARLDAGATVEDCLAAYPQQASDIEGPLRAAVLLRLLPRPAMPAAARAALNT
ncbi:MAG: hypothetical protein H7Y32_09470, partial [Chloroflexales bacterium]|nr:hypothetical protein [Chloroflexales bacterium]